MQHRITSCYLRSLISTITAMVARPGTFRFTLIDKVYFRDFSLLTGFGLVLVCSNQLTFLSKWCQYC